MRTSRPEITVTVDDGVVTLSGYVSSASIKGMASILAGSVDGVSEVVNELLADPDLERSVALALAQDERTRSLPIRPGPFIPGRTRLGLALAPIEPGAR